MDVIESYQIIVNGQSIYTQNYAIEESYITNLASKDAVKRTDIFSKRGIQMSGIIKIQLEQVNYETLLIS
jgi:hypothetical protein